MENHKINQSVKAGQDINKVMNELRTTLYSIRIKKIMDPVFITDDDGKFTFICPNIPLIPGYSIEEMQAMGNISAFMGEVRNLFVLEDLNRQRIISTIGAVIAGKGGTILYVCRDITELKQAEKEREAHIHFLESLERINEVIKQETDVEQMLFMSGYTANVTAHHGVLEEGMCFIQKHFSRNDLNVEVRDALQ